MHVQAVVDYLVNHGADVNARDKRYQTALHIAAASGPVPRAARVRHCATCSLLPHSFCRL